MTRSLYLDRHGTKVGFQAGQLHLAPPEVDAVDIPINQLEYVVVLGHVHFSHDALCALLKQGIPTIISSPQGGYIGTLSGLPGNQVRRRMAQYDATRNSQTQLNIAKALLHAKLRGQFRLLHHWRVEVGELLEHALASLPECQSIDALRGHEGAAARGYFAGLRTHLEGSDFKFMGRHYRPAPDPVNALLSLGYALLVAEMDVGVASAGLDRCAGFLHPPEASRPSLLLDLVEPLRPLVDRLVARLLHHSLSPNDFHMEGEDCRMNDGRRGIFYRAWEDLLDSPIRWRQQNSTWRRVIHLQAQALAAMLDGKTTTPDFWYLDDPG